MTRPLSLEHLTMIDASPRQLIDAAAAGGFDMVGLRVVPPQPANRLMPGFDDPRLLREIKSVSKDTGVAVGMIEAIWLAPETDLNEIERALAIGGELGAQYALVCGNDRDEARTVDNLGAIARTARGYGLEIAFEFMSFVAVSGLEQAQRVGRATGEANVRLLIDALHLSRAGADLSTLTPLDAADVSYVHLCDGAAVPPSTEAALRDEARTGRFYPGEGELPLDDFLAVMPDDARIGLEAPCRAYAHLPPVERGRIAGRVTRAWLRRYEERRAAAASRG
jgi:sugar phosphate isomerase/epimerase